MIYEEQYKDFIWEDEYGNTHHDYDYDEDENTYEEYDKYPSHLKMNRSYIYNRHSYGEHTDWPEHYSNKNMCNAVQKFIEKHVGKSYNKTLHEFVNNPKYADKYHWTSYGTYYTPRKYFDYLFKNDLRWNSALFIVDDKGIIRSNDDKKMYKKVHKDIIIQKGETRCEWDIDTVEKYRSHLIKIFGFAFVEDIYYNRNISTNDWHECQQRIEKYLYKNNIKDEWNCVISVNRFFKWYSTDIVAPYGSKQYNSMKKHYENERKKNRKEYKERINEMTHLAFAEHNTHKKNKKRSFMSEWIKLLKEEYGK